MTVDFSDDVYGYISTVVRVSQGTTEAGLVGAAEAAGADIFFRADLMMRRRDLSLAAFEGMLFSAFYARNVSPRPRAFASLSSYELWIGQRASAVDMVATPGSLVRWFPGPPLAPAAYALYVHPGDPGLHLVLCLESGVVRATPTVLVASSVFTASVFRSAAPSRAWFGYPVTSLASPSALGAPIAVDSSLGLAGAQWLQARALAHR